MSSSKRSDKLRSVGEKRKKRRRGERRGDVRVAIATYPASMIRVEARLVQRTYHTVKDRVCEAGLRTRRSDRGSSSTVESVGCTRGAGAKARGAIAKKRRRRRRTSRSRARPRPTRALEVRECRSLRVGILKPRARVRARSLEGARRTGGERRDRGMSADSRGPRRTLVPAASPCHSCERAKSVGRTSLLAKGSWGRRRSGR